MTTWNKAVPVTASKVYDLGTIFSNNWMAIDAVLSKQHGSLTEASAGEHIPGEVSVLASGGTAYITGLSATAASGAIAWDSDLGQVKFFWPDSWVPVNSFNRSSFVVGLNADFIIPYTATTIPFSGCRAGIDADQRLTGTTEFDNALASPTAYSFSPLASGLYLIAANFIVTSSTTGIDYVQAQIYVNSTHYMAVTHSIGKTPTAAKTFSLSLSSAVYLNAGDRVYAKIFRSSVAYPSPILTLMATGTYWAMYRVI